jgi:hypothetical protein
MQFPTRHKGVTRPVTAETATPKATSKIAAEESAESRTINETLPSSIELHRISQPLYMPSPRSSRINLARFRERVGLRTPQESLAIKRCIWHWGLLSPDHRQPATQGGLAKALGVRRQYVTRILKCLPFDAPIELLAASPVTPAHVIAMRQQHEQSRRQQDEEARREAEDWTEAWREEDSRAQQHGYSPEPEPETVSHAHPSARRGEQELRRIVQESNNPEDRELPKSMFPWLKL